MRKEVKGHGEAVHFTLGQSKGGNGHERDKEMYRYNWDIDSGLSRALLLSTKDIIL